MSDWSSDRLVDAVEAEPGETVDIDIDSSGPALAGDDESLLDNEGRVLRELDLDSPDAVAASGATVRQLAVDEQVWRFGHVIVDEAQDLTPMQWRMVVRRSRRGAVTLLGDLAQRSIGEPGEWNDHLPSELIPNQQRELTVNYRSPAEVNELAGAILARLAPSLSHSRAVRRSGHPPEVVRVDDLAAGVVDAVARAAGRGAPSGSALPPAVIGHDLPGLDGSGVPGCRPLSPWQAKGLEFDEVIVVEPARFLDEPNGLSLLYVALTRSTDRLTIVHHRPLPEVLSVS